MTSLQDPTDPDLMYADQGAVPLARPIMFGDVFRDVPCSRGGAASDLVMVLSHPCSMRKGTVLRERIVTATVEPVPDQRVPRQRWASGFYDYLPLYDLPGVDQLHGVRLSELHAANSSDLDLKQRVLALSDYGIAVLLQRWIYQMSRDPVPIQDIDNLVAPILAETEIQEDWCQVALDVAGEDADVIEVLKQATEAVQNALGTPGSGGPRDRLAEAATRSDARKAIAKLRRDSLGA